MNMHAAASDLEHFLESLAREARPGDRLPPIRDLMRQFGISQMVVQRALRSLKERGLIAAEVGRGTYFRGEGGPATTPLHASSKKVRSVLLLRRSISIARGRALMDGLQCRFTAEGQRVLEVSYTDPDHARTVLKGLPRFDAVVVQSSFKTITIDLLASLRDKCDVIAVDGVALAGADVETVGLEWGEPLAAAVTMLREGGHSRIGFATTDHPFLANQLGLRRFRHLQDAFPNVGIEAITVSRLPGDGYEEELMSKIKALLASPEQAPITALVAWGIEDGAKFRRLMSDAGIDVPSRLSVVLLGRTDLANEHAEFFATVGCRVAEQIESLHQVIVARWANPSLPYEVRLIPVATRTGESVAAPHQPSGSEGRAPSRRAGGKGKTPAPA
jgi:DNA-binding LacI/PurR family transcriptional regulator